MRAPGIYWTRERDRGEWEIEEWRDGWWFSIGDDTVRADDDRMEIGPRVIPPGGSLTKDEALRWYNAGIDCAYDGQGNVAAARWAAWFESAWAKQPASDAALPGSLATPLTAEEAELLRRCVALAQLGGKIEIGESGAALAAIDRVTARGPT